MDPDETLRRLLKAVSDYEDTVGAHGRMHCPTCGSGCKPIDAAGEMRDSIVALDEWLRRGGFLPKAWGADAARLGPLRPAACSQCTPGHAGPDGLCERHGKPIDPLIREQYDREVDEGRIREVTDLLKGDPWRTHGDPWRRPEAGA